MTVISSKMVRIALVFSVALMVAAAILVFSGAVPPYFKRQPDLSAYNPPLPDYRLTRFSELPGWGRDNMTGAFSAFLRSCVLMDGRDDSEPANPHEYLGEGLEGASFSGAVADWRAPCAAAAEIGKALYADDSAWRAAQRGFFETWFQPVQIFDRHTPKPDGPARHRRPLREEAGLFTGYYEPVFPAARTPTMDFSAPIYRRPEDLIDVDLGAFREELAGTRIAGRIEGNKLIPYADHQTINGGALAGKVQPIAWMKPNDLFFLQIQGSGRLWFDDRSAPLRVGYAGQNGHAYTAIGGVMVRREIMPLEDISMQSIRAWLEAATPEEARIMREQNASYVFFRELEVDDPALGPLGAQGVPLTPERSLAVDRRYHMLGAPVWVDLEPIGAFSDRPFRRLMIAQDIGGAIKGPVRGDIFWGAGAAAGEIAGVTKAEGRLFVLVPVPVAERLALRMRS